jgi:hypothetical protein
MALKWYESHDHVVQVLNALDFHISPKLDREFCDEVIADCKAELERRKGILDELTAEAQELKIGY